MPEISDNSNYNAEKEKQLHQWQNRLIKWTTLMPTVLVLIFILIATFQLNKFNNQITKYDSSELSNIKFTLTHPTKNSFLESPEYIRLYTLASMEDIAMRARYSQAGVLLMSKIYTKYLGFFTGMLLSIVGAVFIISKIREDNSNISGSMKDLTVQLVSSSPGIIFGVLGTILMLATILQNPTPNTVKDMPLFLNHYNLGLPLGNSQPTINNKQVEGLPGPSASTLNNPQVDSGNVTKKMLESKP